MIIALSKLIGEINIKLTTHFVFLRIKMKMICPNLLMSVIKNKISFKLINHEDEE